MKIKPMMKCGHAANSIHDGKPACVICAGSNTGWDEIDESPPSLEGRKARCAYRTPGRYGAQGGAMEGGFHGVKPSSSNLPFFEHKPNEAYDEYYCGCFGWD